MFNPVDRLPRRTAARLSGLGSGAAVALTPATGSCGIDTALAADHPRAETDAGRVPFFQRRLGSWHVSISRDTLGAPDLVQRYDRIAARWDRILNRFQSHAAYEALVAEALRDWPLPPRADRPVRRALDCGAGTGAFSVALARQSRGTFRQDAIDLSPAMLAAARARFASAGLDIATRLGDIRALPYEDDTFDVTLAAHVVEHLADPRAGLAELARVTRPGGTIILCASRASLAGRYVQFRWRTHLLSDTDCAALMRGAGLRDIRPLTAQTSPGFRWLSVACAGSKAPAATPPRSDR